MQLVTMGNIAQNPAFQETDDVHYGWKWGVVDGAHVMNSGEDSSKHST
jgi:hypothetical protein